jgi:hypothetical protein
MIQTWGMVDDDEEIDVKPKRSRLLIGFMVVSAVAISSTFASTLTLNSGKTTEFGQGVYQISSCNRFVTVYQTPSAAIYAADGSYTGSGYSNVGNIRISGLDPVACAGTVLRVKLYTAGNPNPLQLYTDTSTAANQSSGSGYTQMVWVISKNPQGNIPNSITLLDENGANVGRYDSKQYLKYTVSTGDWTDIFTYPRAAVSQVNSLTIESTNTP